MSDQQTHWELRKGDIILGTLIAYNWGFPWLDCDFDATENFDEYRDLFMGELRLLDDADRDLPDSVWETAYRKIVESGITFVPITDRAYDLRDDLIDAEGDAADWLRPILGV